MLGQTNVLADGADEPDLSHAEDGAHDAEAERPDGGNAGWERRRGSVDGDIILAVREDEMFRQGDTFVDGEPVALEEEKVSWAREVFGMQGWERSERGGPREQSESEDPRGGDGKPGKQI